MKLVEKQHKNNMKKKSFFVCICFSLLASCQKEIKESSNNTIENKKAMNSEIMILEEQLKKGLKATIGNAVDFQNQYNDDDIKTEEQLINEILKNNGYKKPNHEDFKNKIKLIFQRDLDYSSSKNYVYVNFFDPCNREIIYYQNNTIDYNGIFLFKDQGFVAPLYTIPELIDYQKKYSSIIEYEKNIPINYKNNKGEEIIINKWMDESDLLQKRNQNIQSIIARNKYLFNNSKGDLVWLKFNDKEFLETLVKTFGYVQDKDLVNFVLQNNYKNVDQFEKIILNIRCDQETFLNKEVFDIIKSASAEDQKKYLYTISDIIVKLMKDKNSTLSKNFEKKAEILGKLSYYSSKIGEKNNMYYDFFSILNSDEGGKNYELEFNKNNYYNIPDFKKVWEETRNGGISYPGME